jgi:hypothetical protein
MAAHERNQQTGGEKEYWLCYDLSKKNKPAAV